MEKRYQVFVSSTYQDLQEERQEVMHALLELDCMPSGMELFPAANESQWSLIKKVIDDSDYYVLILAGRYGSLGPEGKSYTEMEYQYALSTNKPVVAFLHKDTSTIASGKSESTQDGREKLAAFRGLVTKKLCKFWSGPAELGSVVSRSLIQLTKSTPAIGWVRADELPDEDATLELFRLRKQVDELQNELRKVKTTPPIGTESLAQGDQRHILKYSFTTSEDYGYNKQRWTGNFGLTWNKLFSAVAPIMINEANEYALGKAINDYVWSAASGTIMEEYGLADLKITSFQIDTNDFHTVLIQLRALGLIIRNTKNRSVKDTGTYWTLTPYGDELMTRLRAIRTTEVSEEKPEGAKIAENNASD